MWNKRPKSRLLKAQAPVAKVTKQEASDVESGDPSASVTQAVPPVVVHITEATKLTLPDLAPVASQADADIGVAISAEYQSASAVATPSGVVVVERDSAVGAVPPNGEASAASGADREVVPALLRTARTRSPQSPLLLLTIQCPVLRTNPPLFQQGARRRSSRHCHTISLRSRRGPHFLSRARTQECQTTTMPYWWTILAKVDL
jgi:hypothetical protein